MSVGQPTYVVGNYLTIASAPTGPMTLAGWVRVDDLSGVYPTLLATSTISDVRHWLGYQAENLRIWNSAYGFSAVLSPIAVGDWVYVALIHNGATLTGYASRNNASSTMVNLARNIADNSELWLLRNGNYGNAFGGYANYVRVWSAVLTQAELDAERTAANAVRTADLWSDCDLPNISDLSDSSGNNNPWTIVGSLGNSTDSPYVAAGGGVFIKMVGNNFRLAGNGGFGF